VRRGQHKTGDGCLYVKHLVDVDRRRLEQLLAASVAGMRRKHFLSGGQLRARRHRPR
jgi:hypothetical protein